jgi:hypothetical protein
MREEERKKGVERSKMMDHETKVGHGDKGQKVEPTSQKTPEV